MARLDYEIKRRGQAIPTIPEELPAPTRMAELRRARIDRGAPITGMTEARGNR